jgi:hypothetical protein
MNRALINRLDNIIANIDTSNRKAIAAAKRPVGNPI